MVERATQISLTAQVVEYQRAMRTAAGSTDELGQSLAAAKVKLQEQHQAMNQVGQGFMAAGALALAATALVTKAAIDWESAWAGVTKTVNGTPGQLQEIEDGLRSMAKELPATHEELAGIAEAAGQLGVERSGILAFTRTMVDLSETTNLSADEASTSIAQLMNIMQTAPDEVDNLGAALVALGNDGASTERDIVQMAQRIAGAGAVIGLSEADVLAFANALASVGIDAEAGGSSISRVMTDIAMAVSDGGEELSKFAQVAGVSGEDFAATFKGDPSEAIVTFIEGLGRINDSGGDVFKTLSDLGQTDIRVSQALLGMANSGDLLRKSLDLGTKAWDENTALAAEAQKRYETTGSKLQVMANRVTDAAIALGDSFLPAVQAGADVLGEFADMLGGMPPQAQAVIAGILGLTAVVGLGGGAFLLAIPKIAEFQIALDTLSSSDIPGVAKAATGLQATMTKTGGAIRSVAGFLTGPWGIALAAAGAGVYILQQALDSLKATSEEYQNAIVTGASIDDLFKLSDEGRIYSVLDKATGSAKDFQAALDIIAHNPFATGLDLSAQQLKGSLKSIGEELAKTADSDLPSAQHAFSELSDKMKLNKDQQLDLLNSMEPYKQALIDVASEQGLAADDASLLALAQTETKNSTQEAAAAYKDAAGEAANLKDQIAQLLDQVNDANNIGQDAVSTNARYKESLAGVSAEVQRQKDAFIQAQSDAYEAANGNLEGFEGTLDGFALSLDETTAAGSGNADMLSGIAANAQAAAEAQYILDQQTMGGKEATDKYVSTLADSKQALIDQATQNGFSADAVQALADKVFALPSQKEINILAQTANAMNSIQGIADYWASRGITIPIYTLKQDEAAANRGPDGYASGGTVVGPGTAKSDSVGVRLSVGEEVTQEPYATQYRSVLKSINAGRGVPMSSLQSPTYMEPRQIQSGGNFNYNQTLVMQPGMSPEMAGKSSVAYAMRKRRGQLG